MEASSEHRPVVAWIGRHGGIRRVACTALLLATLGAAVPVHAQPAPPSAPAPRELRLSTSAPPGSVWARQAESWAASVELESRGQIRLQIFFSGKLGPDTAVIQQVASGRIDMASVSLSSASVLAPELLAVALPMQYRSAAEIDCIVDAGVGAMVGERLARKGLHTIALSSVGTVQFIGKRPLLEPADFAGIKAATTGTRFGVLLWSALGAVPVQISTADLPSAFETGLVAAGLTAPALYVASGMSKLAPVITLVDLYHLPSTLVINKGVWEGLTAEQRAALERARTPPERTRQEVRDAEDRALAAHRQSGGQVVVPSEAQREALRSRLAARYPEMVAETGPEGAQLQARVEDVRRRCEAARRPGGSDDGRTK